MTTDNKSRDKAAKFQELVNVTNKPNHVHEEIKSKLHSRNACYHLVQNLVSSYQ